MLQKVLKSWVYLERKWATLSARRQGWRRKGKTTLFEAKYVSILEISISSKLNHSRHFMHCIYMYFHPAVTNASAEHQGRLLWITCKWLKLLRKASDSKFSAADIRIGVKNIIVIEVGKSAFKFIELIHWGKANIKH